MRWVAFLFVGGIIAACSASNGGGGTGGGGGSSAAGGAAANSGNGGSGAIMTGGNGGSSGTTPLGDAACAKSSTNGQRSPLDMFIVFDKSGSMDTQASGGQSLWDATKGAFLQFIGSPDSDGIGVGLEFFPPGDGSSADCILGVPPNCPPGCIPFGGTFCVPAGDTGCAINDYLPPVVVIQQLPGVKGQITTALNGTSPGGGTPTLPAMQAADQATSTYAKATPERKVIIVLATDGNPNDCNSDIASVANVAAAAQAGNPPVATFVIGINNSGVNTAGLDQIAQAGGTSAALIVDPANAGKDFLDAIKAIQGAALGCTFKVPPPPPGETINPEKVNVWYTPTGGGEQLIYKVKDAASCDPSLGGWYYDNPAVPTEIVLCPVSCNAIGGTDGEVRVELGCDTINIPK